MIEPLILKPMGAEAIDVETLDSDRGV